LSLYLDTSALIKLLVEEPGSDVARAAYVEATQVLSASVGYVEAVSALARMQKGKRITTAELRGRRSELDRLWRAVYIRATDEAVIELAAASAAEDALRAYDAVHLAAALSLAPSQGLDFACWDRELREAATGRGFRLIPESL
jgi:uncharacterized protein